ncbi:MAG: hypothetical protein ACU836_19155 [Gammaproteobacteria bacterium]
MAIEVTSAVVIIILDIIVEAITDTDTFGGILAIHIVDTISAATEEIVITVTRAMVEAIMDPIITVTTFHHTPTIGEAAIIVNDTEPTE